MRQVNNSARMIAALFAFLLAYQAQCKAAERVVREDFIVASDARVHIFVREVWPRGVVSHGVPILLIHGGGPGGIASFDIAVSGYSVAEELAEGGHPVYIMNARGWGQSSRPEAMNEPPSANRPLVCSKQVATDIGHVVSWIRKRHNGQKVALVGWATGGQWANYYLAHGHNESVNSIVTLNSLYPVDAPWKWHDVRAGDVDAYRLADADSFAMRWTQSIPLPDKDLWRDPRVAKMYSVMALASDPTSYLRRPPSTRIPMCYFSESIRLSRGEPLWNPAAIRVSILAIRGERDFWSRPEDLAFVKRAYVNAPRVDTFTIHGGTHYLFLDRPKHGREVFIREVLQFLDDK